MPHRSGSGDGRNVQNDTWSIQARNINSAQAGGGGGGESEYNNILQNLDEDPIQPPRGADWNIHQIDYYFMVLAEDESTSTASAHVTALVELTEGDTVSFHVEKGGDLPTTEFGIEDNDNAQMDAQADRDIDPWISEQLVETNGVDFADGGAPRTGFRASDSWRPPKPIRISDRVDLDFCMSIHNATDTGDSFQMIASIGATVWYTEIPVEAGPAR